VKKVFASLVIGLLITGLTPFTFMDAYAQSPGDMLGSTAEISATPGALVLISQLDGSQMLIGDPTVDRSLSGLSCDLNGQLWGTANEGGASANSLLIEINPTTGALISSIPITNVAGDPGAVQDLATQPGTGILFGTSHILGSAFHAPFADQALLTIDTSTGVATVEGIILTGGADVLSIGFAPDGTLYSTTDNTGGDLLTLDPNDASILTSVASPAGFDKGLGVKGDGTIFTSNFQQISTVNPVDGSVVVLGSPGPDLITDLTFCPSLVGGEFLSLDTTALLVAGITTPVAWMVYAVSAIGIGAFWFARNPYNVRNVKVILEDYFDRFIKRE